MANERTFLAWVRTALALVAGGVALEALGLPLQPDLRLAASLLCLGLGVLVPPLAWLAWGRAERAMRDGRPLPGTLLAPVLGAGVAVVAALVVLATLLP
ncbi:YidH family protein [Aquipuribacter hungaricus]|uniref:YidH family protein n=1 Tax=Aquipuribacter hungaricus TaxID=545624 RepID=A0ABV7WJM2_9MICO